MDEAYGGDIDVLFIRRSELMRAKLMVSAAVLCLVGTALTSAAELESGLPVGGQIIPYRQTKICGNDNIGKDGESFCYT